MTPFRPASLCWLVFSLVLFAAVAAAGPSRPGTAAARRVEPGAVTAPRVATKAAPTPKLSAQVQALLDIQEQGRLQVEELARTIQATPDGPARRALERRAVEVKQETLVRFLQARASLDRTRGDIASALQAEAMVDQILHPRPAAPTGPLTEKPRIATGGQR